MNCCAFLQVDAIVVGADRIAANGDTANKIGTYALSIIAAHHKVCLDWSPSLLGGMFWAFGLVYFYKLCG